MLPPSYATTTEVTFFLSPLYLSFCLFFFFTFVSHFYQQSLGQCYTANGQIAVGGERERGFMLCVARTIG
jgi:hypothetical protein